MSDHPSVDTAGKRHMGEDELRAEIARFEARLMQLDEGNESAYEKALSRAYEQQVHHHRAQLAVLQGKRR